MFNKQHTIESTNKSMNLSVKTLPFKEGKAPRDVNYNKKVGEHEHKKFL